MSYADATTALIDAFVMNDGELTRAQVSEALANYSEHAAQVAKAELESCLGMVFIGTGMGKVYRCPLVMELFVKPKLRLVKGAA